MRNTIQKNITTTVVKYYTVSTNENGTPIVSNIQEYTFLGKPNAKSVKKELEELTSLTVILTGSTAKEDLYEIPVDVFIANAKKVEPKSKED